MGRQADIAPELAHESLLCAYLSLAHLQKPEQFPSWLHGIVRNVCRRYRRVQGECARADWTTPSW